MTDDQDFTGKLMGVPDGGELHVSEMFATVRRRVRIRRGARGSVIGVALLAGVLFIATQSARTAPQQVQTGERGASATTSNTGTPGSRYPTDPRDENYVDPAKIPRYPGWLTEYDPAEVAWFRELHPDQSIVGVVTTLESRRACRDTNTALRTIAAASVADRPALAVRLLDPVVARLTEREPSTKSQADDGFAQIRDMVVGGDLAGAQLIIDRNCSSVVTATDTSATSTAIAGTTPPA